MSVQLYLQELLSLDAPHVENLPELGDSIFIGEQFLSAYTPEMYNYLVSLYGEVKH